MPSDGTKPSRQDQAAAWFAAERAGVMLVEQRTAFDEWKSDPRNQAALDAMYELWDDLRILKGGEPAPRKKIANNRFAYLAAALAIVMIGGIAAVSVFSTQGGTSITTAAGEQKTQSMPDGSMIAVNVASNLSYSISNAQRLVSLGEGEAAFTVKPDKTKPFVVRTGAYVIRAVGTAFNVRHRDGAVEVAVSQGRVEICRVAANGGIDVLASLDAGELLRLPTKPEDLAGQTPVQVPPAQISEWRMRIVTYEDATVLEVVDDFNRYFERKLVLDQPNLAERRITIRLQIEDREEAMETLASLLDLRVIKSSQGDRLTN